MKYFKVKNVKSPERGTPTSAGIDLFVPKDFKAQRIAPGCSLLIPSGLHINIPQGFVLLINNKSSIASKMGLLVGASVIDEDYMGEVHIHIINASNSYQTIKPDMKIVQALLMPISIQSIDEYSSLEELYKFKKSERVGGFGSTGL